MTEMRVSIKLLNDKTIELKVDPSSSIKALKDKIPSSNKEEDVVLYDDTGILLKDEENSLSFYNIKNNCTLQLIKKSVNLTIKLSMDQVLTQLTVSPHVDTIKDIKSKIQHQDDHELVYNGIPLRQDQQDDTLYQLGIHDDVVIHTAPFMNTAVVMIDNKKKKKGRCELKNCSDKVVKIIGDCRYCQSKFCSRHRLPEAHTCINLTSCKQVAHERNSIKLLSERCVASKI